VALKEATAPAAGRALEVSSNQEVQWFSGLGVKAAKGAIEPLKLVPVAGDDGRIMFEDDRDTMAALASETGPCYALLAGLDSLALLRRDLTALVDAADARRKVFGPSGACDLGGLSDLPGHAIFDRGRLIGFWEFDPEARAIVWMAFGVKEPRKDKALKLAVERTEAFVRDELGDARSFSLDSPKSRVPRLEAIRRAAS
jgi:hypothetical protein